MSSKAKAKVLPDPVAFVAAAAAKRTRRVRSKKAEREQREALELLAGALASSHHAEAHLEHLRALQAESQRRSEDLAELERLKYERAIADARERCAKASGLSFGIYRLSPWWDEAYPLGDVFALVPGLDAAVAARIEADSAPETAAAAATEEEDSVGENEDNPFAATSSSSSSSSSSS